MRRITYWLLSTISALVLLFSYHTSTSGALAEDTPPAYVSTTSPGSTTSQGGTRTVTGGVAETQWGPVQVQLTVRDHAITQVSVLQYPSGNQMDDQINAYALPI